MKIIIIGGGWYGMHITNFLLENYKTVEIQILEKTSKFFENSSNYNQNRLHLGYHYPRSFKTRELCKIGYDKFIKKYRNVIDFIDNNFYLISNDSLIDYETYKKIYSNDTKYDHTEIVNRYFTNIDGNIINTKEKIINSKKVKKLFEKNKKLMKFGYEVKKLERKNNRIIINDDLECDLLLDCTYNQLGISKKNYVYELTISLLYQKINDNVCFESLTIMDGEFFSLFPRDISKEKYTLTHVKYTPLIKSYNIQDILTYQIDKKKVKKIIENMEREVKKYYKEFNKDFVYKDYFTSYKCKLIDNNDNRDCIIDKNDNIISVNCGKITGIFKFENYVRNYLDNIIQI